MQEPFLQFSANPFSENIINNIDISDLLKLWNGNWFINPCFQGNVGEDKKVAIIKEIVNSQTPEVACDMLGKIYYCPAKMLNSLGNGVAILDFWNGGLFNVPSSFDIDTVDFSGEA